MGVENDEERGSEGGAGADIPGSASLETTADRQNVTTQQHMSPPAIEISAADATAESAALESSNNVTAPGATRSRVTPVTKRDSASSENQGRVGAVDVRVRAYGNRPVWSRNQPRNPTSSTTSQARPAEIVAGPSSNIPPEMRGVSGSAAAIPPEMRVAGRNNDQSHLPPEMRAVAQPPESAGERDSGEVIVAEVSSALMEESNDKDATQGVGSGNKKTLIYGGMVSLVIIVILLAAVLGILVGGNGSSSESIPVATGNPTENPADTGGACPEYTETLHYIDPDPESMSAEVQALYQDLLGDASPPTCSATNLAAVWVANTFSGENATDQAVANQVALATLYFHWNGQGFSSTWLESPNECTWNGIVCDESGKIVEISSTGSGLQGVALTLPTEIGLVADLKSLRLPNSGLGGSIPDSIGALTNLVILDLYGNEAMTGWFSFDSIQQLKELRSLSLSRNYFMETKLPSSLTHWTNLEVLSLAHLSSTSIGSIPSDINQLSSLKILDLSHDGVAGSMDSMAELEQLAYLSVHNGNMMGTLPTSIGSFENLEWLLLGNNIGLSGPIPSELGGLPTLGGAHFLGTQIGDAGAIPREMLTLQSLESFSASNLDDTVKFTLSEVQNLRCLDIQTTFLSGSIVSDAPEGTCTFEFQEGLPLQDGGTVTGCGAMNRATCRCCKSPNERNCGPNPLALAQCDVYMRLDQIHRRMEVNVTNQIALDYVY